MRACFATDDDDDVYFCVFLYFDWQSLKTGVGYLAVKVAACERRLELSLAAVERDSLRWAGKNTSGEAIAGGRNNKGRQEVISGETRDSGRHEFSSANCRAVTKSWSRGVRRVLISQ